MKSPTNMGTTKYSNNQQVNNFNMNTTYRNDPPAIMASPTLNQPRTEQSNMDLTSYQPVGNSNSANS